MATSSSFTKIDASRQIEEETVRDYNAEHYYPAYIGQHLNHYKIIGKLGYGSASTVWLCRDVRTENKFVALKIYINKSKVHRELLVYNHINNLKLEHGGRDHVRKLFDSFDIKGPCGRHVCLVHEAMGMNFSELRDLTPDGVFGVALIRQTMRTVLAGLQFLHEAQIIHTDLQPSNVLMGINDRSIFTRFEQYEIDTPFPRKEAGGRTIYVSRPMPVSKGLPSISDLSEARFGCENHSDLIMPDVYRAPEVILGMPWSYPVDIWGLAMVIWDLFEGKPLFKRLPRENRDLEASHLAQMIAVLGPPPLDFLARSKDSDRFWNLDGSWKGVVPIPDITLESLDIRLSGRDKELFITFMKKMLRWKPEERGDCRETFFDEWLLADLIESGEIVREE